MGLVAPASRNLTGIVESNSLYSSSYYVLVVEFSEPASFLPGQFAMLNFTGDRQLIFSRPFSILDGAGSRLSFLYRVIGKGTAQMAALRAGDQVASLSPLGTPFPAPATDAAHLLVAGGCGLPPLYAWLHRYGRPRDRAFFGARDGGEVPWTLLGDDWRVSVDRPEGVPADREARTGLVVDLCRSQLGELGPGPWRLLACGPRPMLKAAADLAQEQGWECEVSVEEHMGCGYGVCRGCVIPAAGGGHLTACCDGPVLAAARIDWQRFAGAVAGADAAAPPCQGGF